MLEAIRTICSVVTVLVLAGTLGILLKNLRVKQEPPSVVFYGMDSFKDHLERNPMDTVNIKDPKFNRHDYVDDDDDEEE